MRTEISEMATSPHHSNTRFTKSWTVLAWTLLLLVTTSASAFAAGMWQLDRARHAMSDSFHGGGSEHAMTLPGIDTEFIFEPEGFFAEFNDDTALIFGYAVGRYDSNKRFNVVVTLRNRTDVAPAGSPKKELLSHAYVENGGPIDPSTWRYYETLEGTLRGQGDYAQAIIKLTRRGAAFQVGEGASGKNIRFGGSGWVDYEVTRQPNTGVTLPADGHGDFNLELSVWNCADPAKVDPEYGGSGGHALWIPGIGTDFVFESRPGSLLEDAAGTAKLTGVARRASNPRQAFRVDVTLSGYESLAPAGSPKLELASGAYEWAGGPIDPSTWHYYTQVEGTLTGIQDFGGAKLHISRTGPSFQIGVGANGKNLNYGASSWFDWTRISNPNGGSFPSSGHGDINIDLAACRTRCLTTPQRDLDYLHLNVGNSSIWFADLGFFESEDGGAYIEYEDRAVARTTVVNKDDSTQIFDVEIEFSGRTDVAPADSPKLEVLPEMAYKDHGGPIDPETWYYFEETTGTMKGRGSLEGAILDLERRGPAFQVGRGGSLRNTLFGGSGWLRFHTEQQPNGLSLPSTGLADGFFDFECPPDGTPPEGDCYASTVVSYEPGPSGYGMPEVERMDPHYAVGQPQGTDELNFVSLGFGGSLILEFDEAVLNGPGGQDLQVVETIFSRKSCAQYPDKIRVYASQDGSSWTLLGNACQTRWFSLGSLEWAKYVRIDDTSDLGSFWEGIAADGYGVDGVVGKVCGPPPGDEPECLSPIRFESNLSGETLWKGQVIDDEFSGVGMQVTTSDPVNHPAMIFDSESPSGGDWDLGSSHHDFGGYGYGSGGRMGAAGENSEYLGNILILSEDGHDGSDPDDNIGGGTMIFTFDSPTEISAVELLDIDNASEQGTVKAYDGAGQLITSATMAALGNNSFQTLPVGASGVERLEVHFPKSGALAGIVSCPEE